MSRNKFLFIFFTVVNLTISGVIAESGPSSHSAATSADQLGQLMIDAIKSVVDEAIRVKVEELSQYFEQRIQETQQECQALRAEVFGSNDVNNSIKLIISNGTSMSDTVRRMSGDVQQIKQSLQDLHLIVNPTLVPTPTSVSIPELHTKKTSLSWQEFDELSRTKPYAQHGHSFNGKALSSIIDEVSSASYVSQSVTVVFVNHLDEAVSDFEIHDPKGIAYHQAPSSISAHTEEVFTFKEPADGYVDTSFSYKIPSTNVRIAAFVRFTSDKVGLAFVSPDTDMASYFRSMNGISGSSQRMEQNGLNTLKLSVGYQSYYTRMQVDPIEDKEKAIIRVELIDKGSQPVSEATTTTPVNDFTTTTFPWIARQVIRIRI